jgi:multicomponent Na+:H+ antiporter subunit B
VRSGDLHEHEPLHRPAIAAFAAAAVVLIIAVVVVTLPTGGALPAIARRAMVEALPQWHTTEPVSEVVYGTRATDTFGETFLLLAAVVSAVLFSRHREPRSGFMGESVAGRTEQTQQDPNEPPDRQQLQARAAEAAEWDLDHSRRRQTPDNETVGGPGPETAEQMTVITRTASRVIAPLLAVAGVYLVAEGYSPGGGFPAGAVALGVVLLIYAGYGYRGVEPAVRPSRVELVELVGAFAVVVIEVLGLIVNGSFSANWVHLAPRQTLRSGGVMQLFSVAELVEVGTGLILVIFSFMTMRHDWAPDENDRSR